ncbi:S-layer homology domain-containing protein [Paenibacillus sp. GCM10027626]|uniref:S-layer homology domain-containing protein n=1 Tax=Paenibacillus sp. GCM10027626 TaxID=3273411 RepID=UPI0036333C7B
MKKRRTPLIGGSMAVLMLSQALSITPAQAEPSAPAEGKWLTGEYHVHTVQSSDASEPFMKLENILNAAFREDLEQLPPEAIASLNFGAPFDFLMLSDHLRNSPRDPGGNDKPTARWEAIRDQQATLKQLQEAGKFAGKIIYSGFEWDMMGLDHGSVGIIDSSNDEVPVEAIRQFEWLYSYDTSKDQFHGNEEELWGPRLSKDELKLNKDKTFEAIAWLNQNYPKSFVLPNHPSRHNGSDTGVVRIEDLRKMNDIAPDIVFGMEGMPGNHMAGGENRSEMIDIYGGADVMIAEVGGIWDSLLGEGRRFWNFANSDFHFKVSSNRNYSSGYWPSEFSQNYVWVNGDKFKDVAEGMRSGKSFAVYGHLIDALDFKASAKDGQAEMGGQLQVTEGDNTTITIRFKSPDHNNYAPISDHQTAVTNNVQVDHIDLISGEVTGKLDESEYADTTNETTKVVKRFTKADWGKPDADGYYTITYTVPADKNRYYRLRGTNLGTDVVNYTENGEPLMDQPYKPGDAPESGQNEDRFNFINDRNYTGLWFYSNPIFVNVTELSDEQAVADTIAKITAQLADTSDVTASFTLPSEGLHGAAIQWKSSDERTLTIDQDKAVVTRPSSGSNDARITLTATVTRGGKSADKDFTVIVKALPSDNSNNGSSGYPWPIPVPSKPGVTVLGDGGTTKTNDDGSVSIIADQGYRIKDVTVNGVSKGQLAVLKDLKSTDTVVVTFEKITTEPRPEPEKPTVPSAGFTDVGNHWAASAIDFVVSSGLFTGTSGTTFSPNGQMTRGMFVTVLHRLAGKPAGDSSARFDDTDANAYYYDAVAWASSHGIVNGISSSKFAPDALITREQLALILFNYAKNADYDLSAAQSLSGFADKQLVSSWAAKAMEWAVGSKLLIGSGSSKLKPQDTATRAEVAMVMERLVRSSKE